MSHSGAPFFSAPAGCVPGVILFLLASHLLIRIVFLWENRITYTLLLIATSVFYYSICYIALYVAGPAPCRFLSPAIRPGAL